MTLFNASLKNELKKLMSRKKFIVFLIIEILICAIWCLGTMVAGKVTGGTIGAGALLTNMPLNMLSFMIQIYIPLIIFMGACDLFTGEVQDGTVRATFMRPVSRFKQYFSKVLAILILSLVYMGVLFILTAVIQGVGAGNLSGLGTAFLAYLLDMVPLLILILFAALVNQFSGSPSLSIILCIILYIALALMGILISQTSGLLFTGYLQWHYLWIGTTVPFLAMVPKLGILLGYGLIFGGLGYYLFERREV